MKHSQSLITWHSDLWVVLPLYVLTGPKRVKKINHSYCSKLMQRIWKTLKTLKWDSHCQVFTMRSMNRRFFTSTFSTLWLVRHRNTCSHFHTCWLGDMLIHSENDRVERESVHLRVWAAWIGSHLHVGERVWIYILTVGEWKQKRGMEDWRRGGSVPIKTRLVLPGIHNWMHDCLCLRLTSSVCGCVCVSVHAQAVFAQGRRDSW